MRTTERNTTIIDGYVELLDNLSTNNKLDLISKLSASVKSDLTDKKSSFKKSFGAFDSKKSAEEIIEEKAMMGGLTFMYNGKMCVGIIKDDLMCRIHPDKHDQAVE